MAGTATRKAYWRSLDDLADTPEFQEMVANEFPSRLDALVDPLSRRRFVQVMGASMALAGLTGCDFIRWPEEKILPFATRPEGRHPGTPVQYATAMELGGVGMGLLVTSYDGRPIKVEGNSEHPGSLGATDGYAQASVLGLYDPDRSKDVIQNKRAAGGTEPAISSWDAFAADVATPLKTLIDNKGEKLAVLAEASSSPTLAGLRAKLGTRAQWYEYEAVSSDNALAGSSTALNGRFRTHLLLDKADVVVAFDSDFIHTHPDAVRNARRWASRRGTRGLSRFYAVESTLSVTGSVADSRIALRPSEIMGFAFRVAAELIGNARVSGKVPAEIAKRLNALGGEPGQGPYAADVTAMAADLASNAGKSLIVVGDRQPPALHALGHFLNGWLGNTGKTLSYTAERAQTHSGHVAAIRALCESIDKDGVDTLLILGGNPVLNAPSDLKFASKLERVKRSIHLGLHHDETGQACHWHLPRAHYLESWDDVRSYDGTLSVVQPLISPLYGGRTPSEVLSLVRGEPKPGYTLVRETFQQARGGAAFERSWRRALHDGLVGDPTTPSNTQLRPDNLLAALPATPSAAPTGHDLVFVTDNKVHDGRFANNGWLQELPDPITKLTWDNAFLLSKETAGELSVASSDLITVTAPGGASPVTGPVYIVPGLPPKTLIVSLGYGREQGGIVAKGAGFNAYPLRTSATMRFATGATVAKAGGTYKLATTQDHHAIDTNITRGMTKVRAGYLVREGTPDQVAANPKFAKSAWEGGPEELGMGPDPQQTVLWSPPDKEGEGSERRWGLSIDLSACTGCSACVVACQAENNIPVVGKAEVARGREMHWMRIDRYYSDEPIGPNWLDKKADYSDTPTGRKLRVVHQPLPCQQCENAPCEQVCPVAATTHTSEGLNDMVYNRCVGTRYCANNCPYKVRRFNWFFNHHGPFHPRSEPGHPELPKPPQSLMTGETDGAAPPTSEVQSLVFNPEVTVRSRGVMEKCTYCVQRIKAVTIPANNKGEKVKDGAIRTACEQSCPTQAITFGDLNDPDSKVAKLRAADRAYTILDVLNTRARTFYQAKLRNPPAAT